MSSSNTSKEESGSNEETTVEQNESKTKVSNCILKSFQFYTTTAQYTEDYETFECNNNNNNKFYSYSSKLLM